ncbi:MAG: hypothetical protein ACTSRG_01605 [Candidatus Helarchaeota archaeon]
MNNQTIMEKLIRQLLQSGLLGKGDAVFNTQIGNQIIDLIFETTNEIWIILAKLILDYKVLNQILTYKRICNEQNILTKRLILGIVCKIADSAILPVFEAQNVEVFDMSAQEIFDENVDKVDAEKYPTEHEEEIYQGEICDICGGPIIKDEKDNFICKTIRLHWL